MNSRGARTGIIVVGVIALLVGLVWVGQGLNLIPGSFMTGNTMWFAVGLIVGVVGIIVIVLGLRRGASRRGR